MRWTFTTTDFQEALLEFQQQMGSTYQVSGYENTLTLPKNLGRGQLSLINLRDGIFNLFVNQNLLDETLLIGATEQPPDHAPVVLKFFVSGAVGGAIQGVNDDINAVAGQYSLIYCADRASHVALVAGRDICTVEIVMPPRLFTTMVGEDQQLAELQLKGNQPQPYLATRKTTPLMAIALQQILQCPYQGATRRLYLESKSLELLTLALEHIKTQELVGQARSPLKPEDVQLIYQARDILTSQIHNPPSLMTLARQVGINDCKLKQGFRQVFGTTVFGYLHNHRMEIAAGLLQKNQMTVTGVATEIGFANRSAFAVAFRRKFGLNPSDYKAAHHQQHWTINSAENSS